MNRDDREFIGRTLKHFGNSLMGAACNLMPRPYSAVHAFLDVFAHAFIEVGETIVAGVNDERALPSCPHTNDGGVILITARHDGGPGHWCHACNRAVP